MSSECEMNALGIKGFLFFFSHYVESYPITRVRNTPPSLRVETNFLILSRAHLGFHQASFPFQLQGMEEMEGTKMYLCNSTVIKLKTLIWQLMSVNKFSVIRLCFHSFLCIFLWFLKPKKKKNHHFILYYSLCPTSFSHQVLSVYP